ncbi:MAG: MFS transporter, partial [Pseudomonadota bacterium]
WGTFRFTPYATDVFLMSVTVAGIISVGKMFLKPFGALVAGLVSDKFGIAKSLSYLFGFLVLTFATFAFIPPDPKLWPIMIINVALVSLATFAIRGIYFALLEEGGIPMAVTGTAAGIASVIGFTPDIFMPLLGGVLIDQYPGPEGYRYFFLVTAGICAIGLVAAITIYVKYVKPKKATNS